MAAYQRRGIFRALAPGLAVGWAVIMLLPSGMALALSDTSADDPENVHSHGAASAAQNVPPITGMRAYLSAFGIGESSLAQARDGGPVSQEDEELLVRLLDRVAALQPMELDDWSEPAPDWRSFWDRSAELRGRLFRVHGSLKDVRSVGVAPELATHSGIASYQVLTVSDKQGTTYSIYAWRIPLAWRTKLPIGDRIRLTGIFMKWAGGSAESPIPLLVVDRPAWFPDTLLGRLGMDCALLDDIPQATKDSKRGDDAERSTLERYFLTGRDREVFYQLLAAAGRAKAGSLYQYARQKLDADKMPVFPVVKLFNEPASQIGHLVLLYGTARRIERIDVADADIRRRFGITHYYSIYLFPADSQNNPLVCCVLELPPGIAPGEGPRYSVDLAVAAFFFKTWGYRPERAADGAQRQTAWQLSPLLVGREAIPLAKRSTRGTARLAALFVGVLLLLIGIVWLWVGWMNRRDKIVLTALRRRIGTESATAPPAGPNLGGTSDGEATSDGSSATDPPQGSSE